MKRITVLVFVGVVFFQTKLTLADKVLSADLDNNRERNNSQQNFNTINIDQQLFNNVPDLTTESPHHTPQAAYEEDGCYLIFCEEGVHASYLCHEGITWSVSIVQSPGDDHCLYRRNVTDTSDHSDVREVPVNCSRGRDWLKQLIKSEIIPGIPDEVFFF